jgi:hypothetical protein
MAYIGPEPAESFTSFATQEFSTSATTSYTLDHAVANENEIALFVNNVRQQPGSGKAYTATGTALTLSAATASTDTMYCVFLGRALQTVTPATNSITAAMVGNDLISGKDALTSAPADTDEFLVSDAGTLKRIDYSLIKGGGLTMADQFRINSASTFTGEADITANLERVDTTGQGTLGSGMTESSGIFTFPSTGIYLVSANIAAYKSGDARYVIVFIKGTTDNSSYSSFAEGYSSIKQAESSATYANPSVSTLVDVTNTTNVKVKFAIQATQECTLSTSSSINRCYFTFLRLGDT